MCYTHKSIKASIESWISIEKPYTDMITDLRKKIENDFGKDFLKLMNNAVFVKSMENVRKHKDIQLVKT